MKKFLIIVGLVLALSFSVQAEELVHITGTHWSYAPTPDFAVREVGMVYSEKYGLTIQIFERWKEDGSEQNIDEALTSWKELNTKAVIRSEERGQLGGFDYLRIRVVHTAKLHGFTYFIDTPEKMVEITAMGIGKIDFAVVEADVDKFVKSFQWHEHLPLSRLPYTMDLPAGWQLAEMSAMGDVISATGKYPYIEEPYIEIAYLKLLSKQGADLHQKLDIPWFSDYSDWEIVEKEDVTIGEWPGRIWYLLEKDVAEPQKMLAFRVATDRFIFNVEAIENAALTRDVFWKMAKSWKFVGDEKRSYFR